MANSVSSGPQHELCAALELFNVSKNFGGVYAVTDVNVGFDEGQITCIIGPNGAGKTTLFNIISGSLGADGGEIRLHDQKLNNLPLHEVARLGIGRLFQDVRVFGKMTVLENVCVAWKHNPGERVNLAPFWPLLGGKQERANRERAIEFLAFVGLEKYVDSMAEQLSYGQQKLVAIARLLNNDATCLLLDEPTAGVNPKMVKDLLDIIRKLAMQGHIIVVIEHDLNNVRELGDWVYLMEQGQIEAFGTPDEMLRDTSLKRLMPIR
jgi:branched-chain amino acid transport system permease protein